MTALVLPLGSCQDLHQLPVDKLLAALQQAFVTEVADLCLQDLHKVEQHISCSNLIILLFNESPDAITSTDPLTALYKLVMDRCVDQRRRLVHVVKNFKAIDSDVIRNNMSSRARQMFTFHDLETTTVDELANDLKSSNDTDSFSSPGESFAWQLVAGFLSYILPDFQKCIQSSLLDDQGSIRADILLNFGVTDVDPKQILVLPKYFLLLNEQSVAMCPPELFPGCKKISRASSDLCLEFDSPGYKKRIPSYLMKLEKPLTRDQSPITHVIIFCGYAAPIFIMQKLDMSTEDKQTMFQQFRQELNFILSHPRSNEMLREFGDCSSEEVTGCESSAVQLVDVTDEESVRSCIVQEAEDYLLKRSWCLIPRSLSQPTEPSMLDDLPLMSMAFAMAANTWIGFSQLLLSHIESLTSECQQIPFDLPYHFVIPKSGRYPDEVKLLKRFEEIGVWSEQLEFQVSSGRRYTYRVHEWSSHRMAFEIPASVLGIRKQAECGVGGVKTGHLGAHLAEFRDSLVKFVSGSDGRFRVIEWDDVTGFEDAAWMEPSGDLALSLLNCLM